MSSAVFVLLLLPVAVFAAALDDYYLSRFGENGKSARLLAVAPGDAAQAEHCLTPLVRSLKRDWKQLETGTQKTLAKHVTRPALPASYLSPGGRFTIHYALSGPDAPDLTDADGDNVPEYVEQVAAVFEHVYDVEVTAMGYRPPPVARYDVYLKDLASLSSYGFTDHDLVPAYPTTSVDSYIQIDKAYTSSVLTVNGKYTPLQLLQITAAHEFHHAIQYGYNYYFDIWYGEMAATWIEDEVYDSVNQLYGYLSHYLPRADTISLNAPLGGSSEYGRWIFNRSLAESHSTDLIRMIWERLGTMPATTDGSDIPMLPVIEATIAAQGSTLPADFLAFAKKLYLKNWTTHNAPADLDLIPVVAPKATYSNYPVDASAIDALIAALPVYTFAYYKFLPSASAPAELTLTLTNVPTAVAIVAVKKSVNGSTSEYSFNRAAGTVTVPGFNAPTTAEVQLIIANSTAAPSSVPAPAPAAGSGGGGGGCFIATAAYGSYLHPKVAELRIFRDRHLLGNAPGRLLVSLYYRLSPPAARVIEEHQWLRPGARALLTPVVLSVQHPAGALLAFTLALSGLAWRSSRRRRRRVKFIHLRP